MVHARLQDAVGWEEHQQPVRHRACGLRLPHISPGCQENDFLWHCRWGLALLSFSQHCGVSAIVPLEAQQDVSVNMCQKCEGVFAQQPESN